MAGSRRDAAAPAPAMKRSYIHRKKFLNDSMAQIKATLEFIRLARRSISTPDDSERAALVHAQGVEAVCWSPHANLTAEDYQRIMAAKTSELCRTLLRASLAAPQPAKAGRPVLPVPIIERPAPDAPFAFDLELSDFPTRTFLLEDRIDSERCRQRFGDLDPPF